MNYRRGEIIRLRNEGLTYAEIGRRFGITKERVRQILTANRPKFREMVAAARRKSKPFEAILVWKLSRFARNREDSIIYKSLLRKHGVQVISINEPVDDSAAGRLLEGMIEVIDEFYSTNLSEDTLRGMKENVERGFYNGGHAPFGYKKAKVSMGAIEKSKLEPEEAEAPLPKRAFQMALQGEGGKNIAKALNSDGFATRTGKPWSTTAVNYMLRNEVYTGTLIWRSKSGDVIRTPNAHPALISREDFDKVQQLLGDRRPKVRHPRTVSSEYLLSPLLHCAECGATMIGATAKSGSYHYYKCDNHFKRGKEVCATPMVSKGKIEGFIIDRLKEKVLTDENLTKLVGMVNEEIRLLAHQRREHLNEIERQFESVNQKLLRLYVALETGKLELDDLAPRIKELRAEQTRLQRARDEAVAELEDTEPKELNTEQVLGYVQDLKTLLSKGTLIEQKAFLRSFIKRIEFEPGQVAIDYTIPMPIEKDRTSEREVLSIKRLGSPNLSIDRTFRSVFRIPYPKRQPALTKLAKHRYRNPIILAQECQEALAKGKYASPADLARHIGVSRARVAQLLHVLKLSQEVIDTLLALGDPLPSPIITERNLRPILNLPVETQNRWIAKILTERCEH